MSFSQPPASDLLQVKLALASLKESKATIYQALCDSLKVDYANAKDNVKRRVQIDRDFQQLLDIMRRLTSGSESQARKERLDGAIKSSNDGEERTSGMHRQPDKSGNTTLSDASDLSTGLPSLATSSKSGLCYKAPFSRISHVRLACYSAQEARLTIYKVLCQSLAADHSSAEDDNENCTQTDDDTRRDLKVLRDLTRDTEARGRKIMLTKRELMARTGSKADVVCNVSRKDIKWLRQIALTIEESLMKGTEIICKSLQNDHSNARDDLEKSAQIYQELQENLKFLQEIKSDSETAKKILVPDWDAATRAERKRRRAELQELLKPLPSALDVIIEGRWETSQRRNPGGKTYEEICKEATEHYDELVARVAAKTARTNGVSKALTVG